jgi:hypothetical protein
LHPSIFFLTLQVTALRNVSTQECSHAVGARSGAAATGGKIEDRIKKINLKINLKNYFL